MPDHRYPPQDDYLNVLTWLRDDIYPGLVGHPLDDRGIAAWLCDRFPRLYQTMGVEDAKHRLYEQIARVVNPPPVGPGLAPLQGQLRLEGGTWRDDTGPRLPIFCHFGSAFLEWTMPARRAKVESELDRIQAAGYHGIRFWTRLRGDWWRSQVGEIGQELTPGYWDLMAQFLAELAARQLVCHAGAGDLRHIGESAEDDYIDGMARLVNADPTRFGLLEYVNEALDTDDEDSPYDAIRDMTRFRRLTQDRVLTGLSAYTGHEDQYRFGQWTAPWMEFVLVHALRDGRWWDKIRHIFSLPYEDRTRRNWWHGEPWGVGPRVSAMTQSQKDELTPMVYGLAAAQCAITGGVWTDFFSPGVILGDESFADYPQFGVGPRVLHALEQKARDLGGVEWLRLMHGGKDRPNVFQVTGGHEARCDQAIDDTRGLVFATVYGPEPVSLRNTWDGPVIRLDPVTAEWSQPHTLSNLAPCILVGVK